MELQSLSDELLIYTYLKATEIQLDHSFTSLLYNEIEHRNILDLLESITEEELCRR
ncbi:sporulation histidine kinase inhibitor Sda [Niallia sp. XMNu-256]|uniref:sporulation histidine kinase inhibitor Sda n=1 Tax=Niallia sp. XMNu-256 TaxID=3082444 RepID=UPI0030D19997